MRRRLHVAAFSPLLIGLAACGNDGTAANRPAARFAYVPLTRSQGILGFTIHPHSRELTAVPGRPLDARVASRLVVHPTGRFVYGLSYYTGGTLYGFAVDSATGALNPIPGLPLRGNYKNAVAVAVDGRFLYVANTFPWYECSLPQAPAVTGYAVDPSTGSLTEVATGVPPGTSQWIVAHPSGSLSFTFFSCGSKDAVIQARRVDGATGALLPIAESPLPRALSSTFVPRLDPSGSLLYTRDVYRAGSPLIAYRVEARSGLIDSGTGVEALPPGPSYGDFDFDPNGPRLFLTATSSLSREPATLTVYEIFSSGILGPWSDPLQLPGPSCASVSADPSGRYLYVASSCTSSEPMHGQVWGDPSSLAVIDVEDAGKHLRLERPPITIPEFGAGPFALIR